MLSYTAPKATIQQVLLKHHLSPEAFSNLHVQKVLHRLKICRTASLGYHLYRCTSDKCGEININTTVVATGIARGVAPSKKRNG
jgi:hypothetical protein